MPELKRVGVIVNPIAGMGGRCGLKGTDGQEILAQAIAMGAEPEAPDRATEALKTLARIKDRVECLTVSGRMGADELRAAGFEPTILVSTDGDTTTQDDTRRAARELVAAGVDLILFAGGDGTARDVCAAVGDGSRLPRRPGRLQDPLRRVRHQPAQRRRARRDVPGRRSAAP